MDVRHSAFEQSITLKQAKKLVQCMAHEQSFLLLSPPGVGKSEMVFQAAAESGLPEAAMSLAHLHEHGREASDKEQAIEWYHRAALGFKQARRPDDAEAALRSMENLAARYPAVLGLVTRLRQMLASAGK